VLLVEESAGAAAAEQCQELGGVGVTVPTPFNSRLEGDVEEADLGEAAEGRVDIADVHRRHPPSHGRNGGAEQLIHVDAEVSLVPLHAADYPGPWGPDPAA